MRIDPRACDLIKYFVRVMSELKVIPSNSKYDYYGCNTAFKTGCKPHYICNECRF